jgi:hypothetical protein
MEESRFYENQTESWLKNMIKGDYIVPAWVKPDQQPQRDEPQPLKDIYGVALPEEQDRAQAAGHLHTYCGRW